MVDGFNYATVATVCNERTKIGMGKEVVLGYPLLNMDMGSGVHLFPVFENDVLRYIIEGCQQLF